MSSRPSSIRQNPAPPRSSRCRRLSVHWFLIRGPCRGSPTPRGGPASRTSSSPHRRRTLYLACHRQKHTAGELSRCSSEGGAGAPPPQRAPAGEGLFEVTGVLGAVRGDRGDYEHRGLLRAEIHG